MDALFLGFIVASLALSLSPGPDNLFVIAQGIAHGRKVALLTASGMVTGITVHTLAAALGISAIFRTSTLAFDLVKYAGAAYLLFLAYRTIVDHSSPTIGRPSHGLSLGSSFRKGFLMNVLNPKVALFFLSFLPQFVRPGEGAVPTQMVWLGLTFMGVAWVVFSLIALSAGSLGQWLSRSPRAAKALSLFSAAVFIGLAIRLLFAKNNV